MGKGEHPAARGEGLGWGWHRLLPPAAPPEHRDGRDFTPVPHSSIAASLKAQTRSCFSVSKASR